MAQTKTSYFSKGNVYIINGATQCSAVQEHIQISRQSLRNSLQEFGFNVMSFVGPTDFLDQLQSKATLKLSLPAVLLFDTRLNDWSSLDLQTKLNLLEHAVPMILLGDHHDYREAINAMKQGAIDFWGQPFEMNDICLSVDKAMRVNVQASINYVIADELKVRLDSLTEREREICFLMVQGFGNIEIAARNGTTAGTVKVHRGRVLQKMKVATLAILVNQMGLLFEKPITTLGKNTYELVIANEEKAARASELVAANIELLYQTVEKTKRAGELVIANADKAARASELVTANIELLYQAEEKSKRADELVIANEYEPALRSALLLMLKRALIQLRDRAQDDGKQGAKRIALNRTAVNYTLTTDELESLFPDKPC